MEMEAWQEVFTSLEKGTTARSWLNNQDILSRWGDGCYT